jgi:diguanylate cyclase (GGDEF)-like protein/PAS domain S-box-containing protein
MFLAPLAVVATGVLFDVGIVNYPLFNSLTQVFNVMIAVAIMITAWNSLLLGEGTYLTLIGVAFPFIAIFILGHFLTMEGINQIRGGAGQRSTLMWLSARWLLAGTVLASSLLVGKKIPLKLAALAEFFLTLALLAVIWFWQGFPQAADSGVSIAQWMRLSESALAIVLVSASWLFTHRRSRIDPIVFLLLQIMIGLMLVSELFSAVRGFGFPVDDIVVALSQLLAVLMVYMLTVRSGLTMPFAVLSQDLQQSGLALKRERDFISAILDTADAVVVVLNSKGRIVRVNRACLETTGYQIEELRGRFIWKVGLFPGDADQVLRAFEAEALDQIPRQFDGNLVTRDKRWIRMAWSNAILQDSDLLANYVISTGIDITARFQAEDELRYLSTHDALTGLYNRAYFEAELDRLMRSRFFPVSIIMVDVDGLKQVNDTLGHAAGDELLLHVAEILRAAFRAEDIIARIGGDEFCILLPTADQDVTETVLGRVKENLDLFNGVNPEYPIGISMGAATALNAAGLTASLIKADQVMYEVKSSKPASRD